MVERLLIGVAVLALAGCGGDTVTASTSGSSSASESSESGAGSESGQTETETETSEGETETEASEGETGEAEPSGSCSLVWQATLDTSEGLIGQPYDLALDAEDNLYVAGGFRYVPFISGTAWLAKYDPEGELLWIQAYGEARTLEAIELGPEGSVFGVGLAYAVGDDRPWAVRIDGESGELMWSALVGESEPPYARLHALALAEDDTLFVSGTRFVDDGPESRHWLGQVSALDGSTLWSTTWVAALDDQASASTAIATSLLLPAADPARIYAGAYESWGQVSRPYLYTFEDLDSAPVQGHMLAEVDYGRTWAVLETQAGELVIWIRRYDGGNNLLMGYEPATQTTLWTREGEALEHIILAAGLGPDDDLVVAQEVGGEGAAVRMWDAEGGLLCIEDESFSTGEDFVFDWRGGVGPSGSAAVAGISTLGPNDSRMHIGRFQLDP